LEWGVVATPLSFGAPAKKAAMKHRRTPKFPLRLGDGYNTPAPALRERNFWGTSEGVRLDVQQTLLHALHQDPCDKVAWSALADCLEEQGQVERAELLRLSRLPLAAGADRLAAEGRVRELLGAGVKPCVPTLQNSIGMRLALVPPASFLMGSPEDEAERGDDEGPRHEVEISRPFYLGVFPVTQAQYQKVMGSNPSYFCSLGGGKDQVKGLDTRNFPVEQVSWEDANKFCKELSKLAEEKREKRLYSLPSEAQWEYACRGGAPSSSPFHFGASLSSAQANFDGNYPYGGATVGPYLQRTSAVGAYKIANAFGLFDMHGNVWEWCADWYAADYYAHSPSKAPTGPTTGELRVLRGGSWNDRAWNCRAAYRLRLEPGFRNYDIGFRVVCLLPEGLVSA
jgi:uncharacterized protein (TIGR02996 family)